MSDTKNVHILIAQETIKAVDLIVGRKIGPVKWSRSACIREAIDEYIKRREAIDEFERRRRQRSMSETESNGQKG